MRDFTLDTYKALLEALLAGGYHIIPYETYCETKGEGTEKFVILRHDVDKQPSYSRHIAVIEHTLGIRSTYYFRVREMHPVGTEGGEAEYIRAIADLGHEIGYHYEDLSLTKGDMEKAYAHFQEALAYLRQFYPVRTVCMHGAPTSKWDGKALWKQYDYHDLGIIGEPYFDTPFSEVFYLTDTGRCWDGFRFSVRDKIPGHQDRWTAQGRVFHSTEDLLYTLTEAPAAFPKRVMITTHPQRWTNNPTAWAKELILQTIKNQIKQILIKLR